MPNKVESSSAGVPCDKCNGTGRVAAVIHVHADRPFDAQDPDNKPHYLCGVSLASNAALFARSILVPFVDIRRPLSARSRSTDDYEARLTSYVTSLADAGAKLVAVGGSDVGCRSCRQNLGAKLSKAMETLYETESDEAAGLLDRADGVKHHLMFGKARYINPMAAIGAMTPAVEDPRQVRANARIAAEHAAKVAPKVAARVKRSSPRKPAKRGARK